MKLYKLTDKNGYTRPGAANACKWGRNVTHKGTGKGELCGPGYIHAYLSPELAVLLNPAHANYKSPRLYEASGVIIKTDGQTKVGCLSLKTTKRIKLPKVTTNQLAAFAILCALEVYNDKDFVRWALDYLSGKDRTQKAADAAYAAARAAANTAVSAACAAVYAAVYAACAAVYAADATAYAAVYATAYAAVYAAARAAANTAANKPLKLIKIAKQAMGY